MRTKFLVLRMCCQSTSAFRKLLLFVTASFLSGNKHTSLELNQSSIFPSISFSSNRIWCNCCNWRRTDYSYHMWHVHIVINMTKMNEVGRKEKRRDKDIAKRQAYQCLHAEGAQEFSKRGQKMKLANGFDSLAKILPVPSRPTATAL